MVKRKRGRSLRRRVKRARRGRKYKSAITRQLYYQNPIPVKCKRVLRYATSGSLSIVAGSTPQHILSANGLYDPDFTGVGHQPYTWDQYMQMYSTATVIGAKIRVCFQGGETATADPNGTAVGVAVCDHTASPSEEIYREQGRAIVKPLADGGGTTSTRTITMQVDISKFNNIKHILSEQDYKNTDTANCSKQTFFHIFACSPGQTSADTVYWFADVEYIVIFTQPKSLGQS